jgi:hypothetical protein
MFSVRPAAVGVMTGTQVSQLADSHVFHSLPSAMEDCDAVELALTARSSPRSRK